MTLKIVWSFLLLVSFKLYNSFISLYESKVAVEQLDGNYGISRFIVNDLYGYFVCFIIVLLILVWKNEIVKMVKSCKKYLSSVLMVLFVSSLFCGCIGPAKVEVIDEIKPNETAFVVPLEGNNLDNQKGFESVEYLESIKVATKRISIPQRKKKTGRFEHNFQWIPTVSVIKVDRSPVTREWTPLDNTGTSMGDQGIWVESKDSIGFAVGVNVSALIKEKDAAKFLYYYSNKSLANVMDSNVRGAVYSILSKEFSVRNLQQCKTDKSIIAEKTESILLEKFSDMGITITNFGLVGGLKYEDKEIQQSINDAYTAEMNIQKTDMEKQAQVNINEKMVSIAVAEKQAAQEFSQAQEAMIAKVGLEIQRIKAEATREAANKWDGKTPEKILPQGSNFLFGLDDK